MSREKTRTHYITHMSCIQSYLNKTELLRVMCSVVILTFSKVNHIMSHDHGRQQRGRRQRVKSDQICQSSQQPTAAAVCEPDLT